MARIFGKDLDTASVGGLDITSLVQSIDVEITTVETETTCLVDAWVARQRNRGDFRIRMTLVYDTSEDADLVALLGKLGTANAENLSFSIIAFSGGITYSGTSSGILLSGSQAIPDGGQTVSLELGGDGDGITVS